MIIFIIFLLFVLLQIYFYSVKYKKNNVLIKKIESFENTLETMEQKTDYVLDDSSIELLLEDYNKIKKDI
jgi:hypothetical protein